MKKITGMFLLGLTFTVIGCASTGSYSSLAGQSAGDDMREAVTLWTVEKDYHGTVNILEKMLSSYKGSVEFEQHVVGALALVHLEYGNRDGFLEAADRLASLTDRHDYLTREQQHVLAVAGAMKDTERKELPGRGYDPAQVRTTYQLLGK